MPATTNRATKWKNRLKKGYWFKRGFWYAIFYFGRGFSFGKWNPFKKYTFNHGNLSFKPITLPDTPSKTQQESLKTNQPSMKLIQQRLSTSSKINHPIVLFCGNPGKGKSSLCNSIFQEVKFQSGISFSGMTTRKQEYIYNESKYIDTPGLADVKFSKQAATEIEKALKENNNYKIIFVATLESGRISCPDLITINAVCEAISKEVPFQYGLIFNKVSKRVINMLSYGEKTLDIYYTNLKVKPSSTIFIQNDENMADQMNLHLPSNSEDRKKLLKFIENLNAVKISPQDVQPINVDFMEESIQQMELQLKSKAEKLKTEVQNREKKIAEQGIRKKTF